MGEQITVTWAGREATVEMVACEDYRERGRVAPGLTLMHVIDAPTWYADAAFSDTAHVVSYSLFGSGNSAQEALDSLAEQLRQIAAWANGLLG